MKRFSAKAFLITSCLVISYSAHAGDTKMEVTSTGISNNMPIAKKYAFCMPDGSGKTTNSDNISPEISWSGAPAGTKSYAIVVVDPDVPAKFDDANKPGKTIDANFPRQNFYHWVLLNIPANINKIEEGKGKDAKLGNTLVNDFASFIKDKPAQTFLGYDGPCPPFNDARLHHYHFIVYALDVDSIAAAEFTTGREAISDIEKHALAKGELVGTYSNFIK